MSLFLLHVLGYFDFFVWIFFRINSDFDRPERKFQGAKWPGNERARERVGQGANRPESYWPIRSGERIGPGAKRLGTGVYIYSSQAEMWLFHTVSVCCMYFLLASFSFVLYLLLWHCFRFICTTTQDTWRGEQNHAQRYHRQLPTEKAQRTGAKLAFCWTCWCWYGKFTGYQINCDSCCFCLMQKW